MSSKKIIKDIKTNIERTVQGLTTKKDEFLFENSQTIARKGITYSIYYTLTKEKKYLTGLISSTNSRILQKINEDDLFVKYGDLKSITRTPYPRTTPAKPSQNDYNIGEIRRYFTQKANDNTKPIFEISKSDYENKNSLYKYIDFIWKISGNKKDVIRENNVTLRLIEIEIPGISKVLPPLQLFRPKKNTGEDTRKKLSLLRKT
tara:strand:+ start:500 stop:1111 length:612 start_codon:yes stop_codon:yes gene_type:complete